MKSFVIVIVALLAAGCGDANPLVDAQQEQIAAQTQFTEAQQENIEELEKTIAIYNEYRDENRKTLELGWSAVRQRDEAERRFNRLAVKALGAGLIDGPESLGLPFKTVNGRPFVRVVNSDKWSELEWPSHKEAGHIDLYYGDHPNKRMRAIYLNGEWHAVVIDIESHEASHER